MKCFISIFYSDLMANKIEAIDDDAFADLTNLEDM